MAKYESIRIASRTAYLDCCIPRVGETLLTCVGRYVDHECRTDHISDFDQFVSSEYVPLPTTSSFRYLELSPGSADDKTGSRLYIAEWDDSAAYEAISCIWEDPVGKVVFSLGDVSIGIPGNLFNGLKPMRSYTHRDVCGAT